MMAASAGWHWVPLFASGLLVALAERWRLLQVFSAGECWRCGGRPMFDVGMTLASSLTDGRLLAVALGWCFLPASPVEDFWSWRGVPLAARVRGGRRLLAVVGGWRRPSVLAPAGCCFAGMRRSLPAIVAGGSWRWWGVALAAGFGGRQLLASTVGCRFCCASDARRRQWPRMAAGVGGGCAACPELWR